MSLRKLILLPLTWHIAVALSGAVMLYSAFHWSGSTTPRLDLISRWGGLATFFGFAMSNRAVIRRSYDSTPPSTSEAQIDESAFKWGFFYSGIGTVIWAIGDLLFEMVRGGLRSTPLA